MMRGAALAIALQLGVVVASQHDFVQTPCYTSDAERVTCNEAQPSTECLVCDSSNKNKPTSLTFRYSNNGVTGLSIPGYTPGDGKHEFGGAGLTGPLVSMTCTRGVGVSIAGNDVTLSLSGASDTECTLVASGTQFLTIHTSCSAPIVVGGRWGALTLQSFVGAAQCPQPTECTRCCSTPPATTPVSIDKLFVDKVECTLSGGRMRFPDAEAAVFRQFITEGAGTGLSCATTNFLGDVSLLVSSSVLPQETEANPLAADTLMDALCRKTEYCPSLDVTFKCKESCDPRDVGFTPGFRSAIELGQATFNVGYEDESECPGPSVGKCDVCFSTGSKVKPTTLTLRYASGEPLNLFIQDEPGGGKHKIISGVPLTGALTSVTCTESSVVVGANNVITVSGIQKSSIQCTVNAGGQTQVVEIHTSCSSSLDLGDRYGSLTLIGFGNNQGGETRCPTFPAPACNICEEPVCNKPPTVVTGASPFVAVEHDGDAAGEQFCVDDQIVNATIRAAFIDWFNNRAGAVCETANPEAGGNVITFARIVGVTGNKNRAAVEAALCANSKYCPDVEVEFFCRERCDPAETFEPRISMGQSSFNVGYEERAECPPGPAGPQLPCDVCFPQGSSSKVKPTSLTFSYAANQPVSLQILGNNKPDKHVVSGSALSGDTLVSVSNCDGGSAVVNNNVVTLGSFDGSNIRCDYRDSNNNVQTIEVHTSCSASIDIGDRFGAITLTDFGNAYGGQSQCPVAPPGPPPPCPICANPCTNMPEPHPPTDVTYPKEAVCEAPDLAPQVVPNATATRFQNWLDSFTCTLNNAASEGQPANLTYFYVTAADEHVRFYSIDDVVDQLCNPGDGSDGSACTELEVVFQCCDPCRPEPGQDADLYPALCINNTATFSLTDSQPPTMPWTADTIECSAVNPNSGRPAPTGLNQWIDSAVCRDLGEISDPEVSDGPTYEFIGSCTTIVTVQQSCQDECLNEKLKSQTYTVTDTLPPVFTTPPENETRSCSDGAAAAKTAWMDTNAGAQATDACSGDSAITKVIESSGTCPVVYTMSLTATDNCGLTSTAEATFTLNDQVAPIISNGQVACPDQSGSDVAFCVTKDNVECTAGPIELDEMELNAFLATNGGLTCADECDTEANFENPVILSDTRSSDGCERAVEVRFTCKDGCGNVATAFGKFVIKDTMQPFKIEDIINKTSEQCEVPREDDSQRAAWVRKYSTGEFKWADDACQINPQCYQAQYKEYGSAKSDYSGFCTTEYDPVCAGGSDYTNNCHAMMNGHQSYTEGTCASQATTPPPYDGESCEQACQNSQYASDPVCHDGIQYDSVCYLYCRRVYFGYSSGACTSSPAGSGPQYPPTAANPSGAPPTTAPPSYATPPPTNEYTAPAAPPPYVDPCHYCMGYTNEVCGSDQVTYQSACHATCSGAVSHTVGGCYTSECGESRVVYGVDGFTTDNFFVVWRGVFPNKFKEYVNHDEIDMFPDVKAMWSGGPLPKCKVVDTYTFTAADGGAPGGGGNDGGCSDPIPQLGYYIVIDETPPVITPATNVAIECTAQDGLVDVSAEWADFLSTNGGAECADACQEDTCVFINARYAEGSGGPPGPIDPQAEPVFSPCDYHSGDQCALVTFTAEDGCGNFIETTAEFRVRDTTPPDFVVDDRLEQCIGAYPIQFFTDFGVEIDPDNTECNPPGTAWDPHFILFGNPYKPPYGWNTVMPEGIHGVPPAYLPDDVWEYIEENFGSYVEDGLISRDDKQCPFITVATIKVKDAVGNFAKKNATHIFLDSTPPIFSTAPQPLTIECDGPHSLYRSEEFKAWLQDGAGGRCQDECTAFGDIEEIPMFSHDIPEKFGSCPETVNVTFTCTDFCGNTKSMVGQVFIQDTTPPNSVQVVSVTRECGEEHASGNTLQEWLDDYGNCGATDLCSAVTVTEPENVELVKIGNRKCNDSEANACWTFADECGNSVQECGTFSVIDTKAPVVTGGFNLDFTCPPLSCGNREVVARAVLNKWLAEANGCLEAEDCQEDMTWSNNFPDGDATLCGTDGEVQFTVTDACGNAAAAVTKQYIFRNPNPPSPPPPAQQCLVCNRDQKRSLKTLRFRWESDNGMPAVLTGDYLWTVIPESTPDGGEVTIQGKLKSAGVYRFESNTIISISGFGSQTIHTSCSQPIFVGQTLQYNGGRLTITGFSTNNGITEGSVCAPVTPPPPGPAESCDVVVDDVDVCTCIPTAGPPPQQEEICGVTDGNKASKPTRIVFQYVGGFVDPTLTQGDKGGISGAPVDSATATVSCIRTQKGQETPAATVAKGGFYVVDANGNKLGTEIECTVTGENGLSQVVEIHTSCSARLVIGDRFGALQLVGFSAIDGRGTTDPVGGSNPGAFCPSPGPAPSPNPPPPPASNCVACGDAAGGKADLTSLTFKYVGGNQLTNFQEGKASVSGTSFNSPAVVSVRCNADLVPLLSPDGLALAKGGKSSSSGGGGGGSGSGGGAPVQVALGGSFDTLNFPNDMECTVQSSTGGVIQTIELHTSCSKDLVVGDIFGSLQLVGFSGSLGSVTEENACAGILQPDARSCSGMSVDDCINSLSGEPISPGVVDVYECSGCDCDVCVAGGGIPTMLEFEFTGGDSYSTTQPLDGPVTLFHGPGYKPSDQFKSTGLEEIVINPHDYGIVTSAVAIGQRFRLTAAALERTTLPQGVNMLVGRTRVKMVINCRPDYPLSLGDEWGPIKLVAYALDAPQSDSDPNSITGHCPASSSASGTWGSFSGSSSSSTSAGSGVAVAGLVAGLLLVAVMVIGVYRMRTRQVVTVLSDPGSSTADLQGAGHDDLQWDTTVNQKDKLRPRLTNDVE